MKSNYIDRTLIRLKRVYSKDEVVSALSKKLKEVQFELGVVTSERDEYLDELNSLRVIKNNYENVLRGNKNMKTKNLNLRLENEHLIKENTDLRNKIF